MKFCTDCANSYAHTERPKYILCRKSDKEPSHDETFAANMRQGECGPEAKLWEPRNV